MEARILQSKVCSSSARTKPREVLRTIENETQLLRWKRWNSWKSVDKLCYSLQVTRLCSQYNSKIKDHPILVARDLRSRNQPRKVRREHVDDLVHRLVTSTTSCRWETLTPMKYNFVRTPSKGVDVHLPNVCVVNVFWTDCEDSRILEKERGEDSTSHSNRVYVTWFKWKKWQRR